MNNTVVACGCLRWSFPDLMELTCASDWTGATHSSSSATFLRGSRLLQLLCICAVTRQTGITQTRVRWDGWIGNNFTVLCFTNLTSMLTMTRCAVAGETRGYSGEVQPSVQLRQLAYQIHLYEPAVSDTYLVTRFILGLKDELKGAVKIQFPTTVAAAAAYATVQEETLKRAKTN